jgi:tRNA1(Val) A37 N6-methylase TrmN6
LARRSARYNGVARRFVVLSGDFRTPLDPGFREPFDWVTGSPPYLTGSEGRRSLHPQRGPCRFEDRGGIDAYLHAAATYARPGAGVTWVHASRYTELSLAAADAHGLGEVRCRPVIFREGRESLISLFEARVGSPWSLLRERPLLVRDTAGEWSEEFRFVREEMGFPV